MLIAELGAEHFLCTCIVQLLARSQCTKHSYNSRLKCVVVVLRAGDLLHAIYLFV